VPLKIKLWEDEVSTLRANGPAIERLIQELQAKDPTVNYEQISRRTEEVAAKKGSGLVAMTVRTLYDARQSEPISLDRLHALAKVLGVKVDEIILNENAVLQTVPPQALTLIMNLPRELLDTELVKKLVSLPEQTVQNFLDVVTTLTSTLGATMTQVDKSKQMLQELAAKNFAARVDNPSASKFFSSSRNPEKEQRFERNTRMILERVAKYLNSDEVPKQRPDETFLDYFGEYCQKISDPDVQEFWAEILAAKIRRPEGISLRTLRLIQDINQNVAQIWTKFCGLVFKVDGDCVSIRLENDQDPLVWAGLTFPDLLILADYGLASLGVKAYEADAGSHFVYFQRSFQAKKLLKFKSNPLTEVGKELFALTKTKESEIYFDAVWKMFGDGVGPVQVATS
jgi:Protein of unknown function (DUF2806)